MRGDNRRFFTDDVANLKSTDRFLPVANISKIMKGPLPAHAKVSKEAKEIMQKSASEFIAIISCRAKDLCDSEARKTLTGEDLIRAMDELDMPYYAEIARKYFMAYKDSNKDDRTRRIFIRKEFEDSDRF